MDRYSAKHRNPNGVRSNAASSTRRNYFRTGADLFWGWKTICGILIKDQRKYHIQSGKKPCSSISKNE